MADTRSNPFTLGESITTTASEEMGGKSPPNKLILLSENWVQLQTAVTSGLKLPISTNDFNAVYGDFSGQSDIEGCVEAMRSVQAASVEFGNPQTTRAALIADPDALNARTPETLSLYEHIVWLAERTRRRAVEYETWFGTSLPKILDKNKDEAISDIVAIINRPEKGLMATAETAKAEINTLVAGLLKFEQKMGEYQEAMVKYTSASSGFRADLDRTLGEYAKTIKDLEEKRDAANKAWQDWIAASVGIAIGAAIVGLALAVPTMGLSVVGAGAGITAAAIHTASFKAKYNAYVKQIAEQRAEQRKKNQLRTDLGGLDTSMTDILPAIGNVVTNLQTIGSAWHGMTQKLGNVEAQLRAVAGEDWLVFVETKLQVAATEWASIGKASEEFGARSLVDYKSVAFGVPVELSDEEKKAAA